MTCSVNETRSRAYAGSRVHCVAHIVGFVCASLIVAHSSPSTAQSIEASPYRNLEVFARALAHIEQSYVDPPDVERLMHGAIRGMLEELDPHSTFLDAGQLRILQDDAEGRYAGIGTEIETRDGWLIVHAVLDGGSAHRAGVKPGDRFLAIDGLAARDLPLEDAIRRMRGEPGTRVRVALRRAGVEDAIELELSRELVTVRAVDARVLADRIVVMQLRLFQDTTASEFARALDDAQDACAERGGIAGLVLDLRDNPGGLVNAAVAVADELLSNGVIVETRGRGDRVMQTETANDGGTRPAFPIVLVVNARTASAAEILAGALRDHKRAVIVGERTFGKGSVQNVIDLPDGSAIKLTTARYYTPLGDAIQARGIEPDVTVAEASATPAQSIEQAPLREADLERHLDSESPIAVARAFEARGARSSGSAQHDAEGPLSSDTQAFTALQVLRALIAAAR